MALKRKTKRHYRHKQKTQHRRHHKQKTRRRLISGGNYEKDSPWS